MSSVQAKAFVPSLVPGREGRAGAEARKPHVWDILNTKKLPFFI